MVFVRAQFIFKETQRTTTTKKFPFPNVIAFYLSVALNIFTSVYTAHQLVAFLWPTLFYECKKEMLESKEKNRYRAIEKDALADASIRFISLVVYFFHAKSPRINTEKWNEI